MIVSFTMQVKLIVLVCDFPRADVILVKISNYKKRNNNRYHIIAYVYILLHTFSYLSPSYYAESSNHLQT